MLCGYFMGIAFACVLGYPKWNIALLAMLPLVADGTLQKVTAYTGNNFIRMVTGVLFGAACIFLLIHFHLFHVALIKRLLENR